MIQEHLITKDQALALLRSADDPESASANQEITELVQAAREKLMNLREHAWK